MTRTTLVVDDDLALRRLITTTLEDIAGFRVREAGDGQEALETAVEERPQIVFLDYAMPRVDGVETCRRLRSDPVTAGATTFPTKPFFPLRLAYAIGANGR